jgi:hypothetical protein
MKNDPALPADDDARSPEPIYGSFKDVERRFGLKKGWIERRVDTGEIVRYKAGRLTRFDLDAIERLVRTPPPQQSVARSRRGRFDRKGGGRGLR